MKLTLLAGVYKELAGPYNSSRIFDWLPFELWIDDISDPAGLFMEAS